MADETRTTPADLSTPPDFTRFAPRIGDLGAGNMRPQQTYSVPPFDWKAFFRDWLSGAKTQHANLYRGQPAPEMPAEHRTVLVPQPAPFGTWRRRVTRRHERGAYAYGYEGGIIQYDPIGTAFVVPWKGPPVEPGRTAQITGGVIYWNTTPQNQAHVPAAGGQPIAPKDLIALLGLNSAAAVAAGTANPYNVAPPPVGFFA